MGGAGFDAGTCMSSNSTSPWRGQSMSKLQRGVLGGEVQWHLADDGSLVDGESYNVDYVNLADTNCTASRAAYHLQGVWPGHHGLRGEGGQCSVATREVSLACQNRLTWLEGNPAWTFEQCSESLQDGAQCAGLHSGEGHGHGGMAYGENYVQDFDIKQGSRWLEKHYIEKFIYKVDNVYGMETGFPEPDSINGNDSVILEDTEDTAMCFKEEKETTDMKEFRENNITDMCSCCLFTNEENMCSAAMNPYDSYFFKTMCLTLVLLAVAGLGAFGGSVRRKVGERLRCKRRYRGKDKRQRFRKSHLSRLVRKCHLKGICFLVMLSSGQAMDQQILAQIVEVATRAATEAVRASSTGGASSSSGLESATKILKSPDTFSGEDALSFTGRKLQFESWLCFGDSRFTNLLSKVEGMTVEPNPSTYDADQLALGTGSMLCCQAT